MSLDKEFVSYEQALALKELGFDERCYGHYANDINHTLFTNGNRPPGIPAPLYQQAFRWFREKHSIFSWLTRHRFNLTTSLGNKEYYRWALEYEVVSSEPHINSEIIYSVKEFNTYEEVEQACLDKLIEIVKNGKQYATPHENT